MLYFFKIPKVSHGWSNDPSLIETLQEYRQCILPLFILFVLEH